MLEELSARDFALIERLSVGFRDGFTVLSGETGAGKSLLIGAIGFILGGRADTGIIRTGAEEALVSAQFSVAAGSPAWEWLEGRGLPVDEGRIVLRRSLRSNGRGQIHIQGQAALRADLAALSACLVDIHGQHEQQGLLQQENHRAILDRYAGLSERVASYAAEFARLSALRRDFDAAESAGRERARELDFLDFAIGELEAAGLRPGELEELEAEELLLSQHEKLFAAVDDAHRLLGGSDGTLSQLRHGRAALEGALAIDPKLATLSGRLEDAYYELEDIGDSLRAYLGAASFDPGRLELVESRLAELGKLRRKYGGSTEEMLARLAEDRSRRDALATWDEDREARQGEIAAIEARLFEEATAISAARKSGAGDLALGIEKVLAELGMGRARIQVRVERKERVGGKPVIGQQGIDEVEFLIAPNPGETPRPLSRIASGGELSRIALAAKTVLAATDPAPTLVFDEVDAGIGGEVAVAVGAYLAGLGAAKQVFCITHLASIAARADNHYRVEKLVEGGRTQTRLVEMAGRERSSEIARMLAGDADEEASIAHAVELLRRYGTWRD